MATLPFNMPAVTIACAIAAAALLSGCSRSEAPVSVASLRAAEAPDQESWNTAFYITEGGLPQLHMRAFYIAQYEREDSTYMILSGSGRDDERVRVDLFDDSGDSSAVVFADRLTYYERERKFIARGNVRVRTRDDEFLESEHLAWSESLGKLSTPGFVRYTSEGKIISGYEFEANDDLTGKKLKRVNAIIDVEE